MTSELVPRGISAEVQIHSADSSFTYLSISRMRSYTYTRFLHRSRILQPTAPSRFFSSTIPKLSTSTSQTPDEKPQHKTDQSQNQSHNQNRDTQAQDTQSKPNPNSVTAQDAQLREKLEQMSGGGGVAGLELEDGKANTMKRSVRNNMFRYI